MGRFVDLRIPRFEHNKNGFIYPFKQIKDLSTIVIPFLEQTREKALELLGDFPNNIEQWIWSSCGTKNYEPWFLICSISPCTYVFFSAKIYINNKYISIMVCKSLKEIIEYALTEDEYNIYINKTHSSDIVNIFPKIL